MEGAKPYMYIYEVRKLLDETGDKLVERVIKQGDVDEAPGAPEFLQSVIVSVRQEVSK